MKHRDIGLLSIGHLVTDINQGALPAMLLFFISAYDLSYAAAAGIVFAANMTSSIVQPLFGHAADRFSKPWLLSAGLMLAGIGLALSGLFQSYEWIVFLAVVSGIGIAAYHTEAARLVNFAAGTKKGTAMSLFGVGGHHWVRHRTTYNHRSLARMGAKRNTNPSLTSDHNGLGYGVSVFFV